MNDTLKDTRAPRSLVHNGNSYYRIGGTKILTDMGAIFYCAENNSTLKMDKEGNVLETDFQSLFKNKLFNPLSESRVYYSNNVGLGGDVMMPIVIRRLSFLKLKNKHIMKKIKGQRHTIIAFKQPEDLAQFRIYFSEFFVG
jgi:hypothetical protein